jgi:hypothetical protein
VAEVEELQERVLGLHRRLADFVRPLRALLKEVEAERSLLDRARIALGGAADFLREFSNPCKALGRRAQDYRDGWRGCSGRRAAPIAF